MQDFREINQASFEDKFSIRDARDCIDAIGKSASNIFSTLDLAAMPGAGIPPDDSIYSAVTE